MAAVFQELALTWKGEEYRVKPTIKILNRIEQDVSISSVAHRLTTGHPPMSQLATIVAGFLREAGAKVTAEEVYEELMSGTSDQITEMTQAVIMACFPSAGKQEAPAKKKNSRK